jgi:deoxyhypusine synthase
MNDTSIPQEIKDDILKRSQQAIATNNNLATVDIYTPDRETTTISPMTQLPDRYYTYQGKNMKDTVVYYTDYRSPDCEISKGFNSGNIANGIRDLIITIAGLSNNNYISIFTTGVSILQNFFTMFGANVYHGTSGDYCEFEATYDIYTKWTFVDLFGDGSWATGAVTEKVC